MNKLTCCSLANAFRATLPEPENGRIGTLPDEMVFRIFSYLPKLKDYLALGTVCKNWYLLRADPYFWYMVAESLKIPVEKPLSPPSSFGSDLKAHALFLQVADFPPFLRLQDELQAYKHFAHHETLHPQTLQDIGSSVEKEARFLADCLYHTDYTDQQLAEAFKSHYRTQVVFNDHPGVGCPIATLRFAQFAGNNSLLRNYFTFVTRIRNGHARDRQTNEWTSWHQMFVEFSFGDFKELLQREHFTIPSKAQFLIALPKDKSAILDDFGSQDEFEQSIILDDVILFFNSLFDVSPPLTSVGPQKGVAFIDFTNDDEDVHYLNMFLYGSYKKGLEDAETPCVIYKPHDFINDFLEIFNKRCQETPPLDKDQLNTIYKLFQIMVTVRGDNPPLLLCFPELFQNSRKRKREEEGSQSEADLPLSN